MNAKVIKGFAPKVYIDNNAYNKMEEYIHQSSDEIGWLGCAEKINGAYHITDVFLFKQEVHSTTTEITTEGLNEFAMEIMSTEDGMDIWNNMRVWGHSHVNMSTTPSGQDENQMDLFLENTNDFFIRIIANKKGEYRIDIYDYEIGICYTEVPYDIYYDGDLGAQIDLITSQIKILRNKLEKLTEIPQTLKKEIENEIKEKVSKKTYPTTNYYNGMYGYGSTYKGTNYQQSWYKNSKKKEEIDVNNLFDTLTEEEIYIIMETIDNGGTSMDVLENSNLDYYSSYQLDELITEFVEQNIESYYAWSQGEVF